jgi:hypothetical protein
MLSAALIVVSLSIGYILVVGLVGSTTYGLAMLKPSLAVRDHRITTTFNLFQDVVWLIFSALGGYVVATGAAEASPRLAAALFAAILIFVVWRNMDEARHRGMIHMLITSSFILVGIAAGYFLHMHQLPAIIPPQ